MVPRLSLGLALKEEVDMGEPTAEIGEPLDAWMAEDGSGAMAGILSGVLARSRNTGRKTATWSRAN